MPPAKHLTSLSVAFAIACGSAWADDAPEASTALLCDAPGRIFTDSEVPSFRLKNASFKKPKTYEILDWKGVKAAGGTWNGAGTLTFSGLGKGYYTIKVEGLSGESSFCVVADPAKWTRNPESFFAMDTAQSWLAARKPNNPRQPEDGFATVSDICRLAGLSQVRERMSWNEVSKEPFTYSWGRYMVNAKLLSERGVKISGMFHDAPKWARGSSGKLPDNLLALHEFCRVAGTVFKGKMNAWEFWNEEDISFCDQPAWDFAAAQKAAFLGFREGAPDTPVLLGALCKWPLSEFSERIFENGAGDYFDIFNFHHYSSFGDYAARQKDLKELLERYGRSDAPIWITENGSNYEGPGRLDSFIKGFKEHDKDQELMLAEFAPKSQILQQSLGVARDFFFVLPAYNERDGTKAWGLLRHDYSAKPAFAAFANMCYQLSRAKYLGVFELAKGAKGFLYGQPDGTQTLVFWSESELDSSRKENIKADFKKDFAIDFELGGIAASPEPTLSDLMGGVSKVFAKNGTLRLKAGRFPAYLNGLKGLSPSIPAPAVPKPDLARDSGKELAIVYKLKLGEGFKTSKEYATLLEERGKLSLEVYNFSPDWKKGSIAVAGELRVEGLPKEVELPPYGKISLPCEAFPEMPKGVFTGKAVFGGVFDGKAVSRLRMDFRALKALEAATDAKRMDFMNPERWRVNSSGEMKISFDKAEKALRVDVKFKEGDHWVYPEYVLKEGESLDGAIGVRFDVKAVQKGGNTFPYALLMAVKQDLKETGERIDFDYTPPEKEWNSSSVDFAVRKGFEPSKVKMLRLGMNPKGSELSYWIKNMEILFPKKD